jgi:UDP-glucose 4-epimerase
MLANSKVLLTGGAGFIGSHLTSRLLSIPCQLTVVDNLCTGSMLNLGDNHKKANFIKDDLGELLRQGKVNLEEFDYIFHLAGNAYVPVSVENPQYDLSSTQMNTFEILEHLKGLKKKPKLIYPSSAAVYGDPLTFPIKEGDQTVPVSPYGVSKLAAERYIYVYCRLFGVRAVILRLFSVYGPRQRKQVVFDLLKRLTDCPTKLEVHGDGTQVRDFVYVGDVVEAMIIAAQSEIEKGEVYNVASGSAISIRELVNTWVSILGLKPEIVYNGDLRPGDADKWTVDIKKLTGLGYKPAVPLAEGLDHLQKWFYNEHLRQAQSVPSA